MSTTIEQNVDVRKLAQQSIELATHWRSCGERTAINAVQSNGWKSSSVIRLEAN